jgi:hypothetical protein
MSNQPNRSPLVSYLILVVLVFILGCLAILVYKAFEPRPLPPETEVRAEINVPLPDSAPASGRAVGESIVRATPGAESVEVVSVTVVKPPNIVRTVVGKSATPAVTSEAPQTNLMGDPITRIRVINGPLVKFVAQPTGSEMRMDGNSVMGDWNCRSTILIGSFQTDPPFRDDPTLRTSRCLGAGKAPNCKVAIPVRSLRSSGGPGMDQIMQTAMNGHEFKNIEFVLTEMLSPSNVPPSGSPVTFDCKGNLAVAGRTNPISFRVIMERLDGSKLRFTGSTSVKMSDFGLRLPGPVFGELKIITNDAVRLKWTWVVGLENRH